MLPLSIWFASAQPYTSPVDRINPVIPGTVFGNTTLGGGIISAGVKTAEVATKLAAKDKVSASNIYDVALETKLFGELTPLVSLIGSLIKGGDKK